MGRQERSVLPRKPGRDNAALPSPGFDVCTALLMSAEDDRPEGQPLLPEFGKVLLLLHEACTKARRRRRISASSSRFHVRQHCKVPALITGGRGPAVAEPRSSGVKARYLVQCVETGPDTGGVMQAGRPASAQRKGQEARKIMSCGLRIAGVECRVSGVGCQRYRLTLDTGYPTHSFAIRY